MSGELLGCPFCGKDEADVVMTVYGWRAGCPVCGAEATNEKTTEAAIAAWNRRAEPEPTTDGQRRFTMRNELTGQEAEFSYPAYIDDYDRRLDALAERVATLETIAGYGPRAGRGFRVVVERGEPSEG